MAHRGRGIRAPTPRQTKTRRALTNVTVVEGGERSTNLPAGCCDAILVRDVYHHLTAPEDMTSSLAAALRPGGGWSWLIFCRARIPTFLRASRPTAAATGCRRTW